MKCTDNLAGSLCATDGVGVRTFQVKGSFYSKLPFVSRGEINQVNGEASVSENAVAMTK